MLMWKKNSVYLESPRPGLSSVRGEYEDEVNGGVQGWEQKNKPSSWGPWRRGRCRPGPGCSSGGSRGRGRTGAATRSAGWRRTSRRRMRGRQGEGRRGRGCCCRCLHPPQPGTASPLGHSGGGGGGQSRWSTEHTCTAWQPMMTTTKKKKKTNTKMK